MEGVRPVSIWRLAAAGHATLLLAMGIGRFSYTPMVPPLIISGTLTEAEAGYVGACNLAGNLAGALCIPAMRRRLGALPMLRLGILICFLGVAASAVPLGFVWLGSCRFVIGATASWMMVLSSLIFGAQPGLSAVISGRTGQVVGRQDMAEVWRWMVLSVAVTKAVAGYRMAWLFDLTGSYTILFIAGGVALALGALLSLPWPDIKRPEIGRNADR